ncbi:MAG: hypothetical protein ACREL9_08060 [Gemmatimonadales bacterium]
MSDRALQDEVIRALADAPHRASAEWRERQLADPDRVERFARFLARHFYFERIVHFFKYSRALARVTGRRPDAVLKRPAFEALLPTLVLGSRPSARAVAELVVAYVQEPEVAVPYLDDLHQYERAMMVVEAGPRVWRDPVDQHDGVVGSAWSAPERVEGTVLLDLAHDLPGVLPKLLQPWTDVPVATMQRTRLLIARSKHGRVAVARTTRAIAAVVQLADGKKTLEDLAREAGLRPAEVEATLEGLVDIGAVRFSTGS